MINHYLSILTDELRAEGLLSPNTPVPQPKEPS